MASVLKTIEDLAGNIAPAYTTSHIVPRGVPRFVDNRLKGTLKYSRRIGNTLPTIQPQNRITLEETATLFQNILKVSTILPDFLPGSLIKINSQEVLEIEDVDTNLQFLTLTEDLLVEHEAGVAIDLFAAPVYVYGPVAPGGVLPANTTTKLYIRTSKNIITGDQLYIQQDASLLLSGTDFTVIEAVPLGTNANDFIVSVTLDNPIPRDLTVNDKLYLRTFPGYVSPKVIIPMHRRRPIYLGPFVVDYVSGRFDDGDEITENLDIQGFDAADVPFFGTAPPEATSTYYVRAYKNFPVIAVPIHASSFMFWDIVKGKINYTGESFILETDSDGHAVISKELKPGWTGPQTWICQARGLTATYGSFYYSFDPNPNTFAGAITNTTNTTLEINLSGETANRLEITFVGQPNSMVQFNSWAPVIKSGTNYIEHSVTKLQYTIAAQVTGNNIWQSGSLMIKPYFSVIADIEATFDYDSFDNGAVMF